MPPAGNVSETPRDVRCMGDYREERGESSLNDDQEIVPFLPNRAHEGGEIEVVIAQQAATSAVDVNVSHEAQAIKDAGILFAREHVQLDLGPGTPDIPEERQG